jgi:HlyD family secretion protein
MALPAARRSERSAGAARLIDPAELDGSAGAACCIELKAPVSGRVLRLVQESEAVVQAGTPLIELGDPSDIEVVADLLTSEAVRIEVGSDVLIDGWGGAPIRGKVARIDPAGFTKLSALGIEEQRVRTIIDLTESPKSWSRLGHDFRVIVDVTTWRSDDELTVPVAGLFREGEDWAVFRVHEGRARTTRVTIGQRNSRVAQVLAGLAEGEQIVLHPSDRVGDGTRVAARQSY